MPGGLPQDLYHIRNARVGVFEFYQAAEDTVYTSAAPAWQSVGIVDPGSLDCDITRTIFELMLGMPRTTKVQVVTGVSASLKFGLTEYNAAGVELAAGSGTQVRTYSTSPAATTIASSPTVNGATLTSGTGFAVGQLIEVSLPSSRTELVYVDTVAGAAITWKPATSVAPIASAAVKGVKSIQQALGTSKIVRIASKIVFTDQNLETATVHFPACSSVGNYKPNFKDATSNVILPIELKAYGKQATWNGVNEAVVGYVYHDYPLVS